MSRKKKGPHSSESSKKRGGKDVSMGNMRSPSPATPLGLHSLGWKESDGDDDAVDTDGGIGDERVRLVRVSPEQHQSDASARLSRGLATTSNIPITGPFAPTMTMAPLHTALTRKSTVRPASASRQGLGPGSGSGPGQTKVGVRTSTSSINIGGDSTSAGGVGVGGGVGKKGKERERPKAEKKTVRPSSAPSSSSRHSHTHR